MLEKQRSTHTRLHKRCAYLQLRDIRHTNHGIVAVACGCQPRSVQLKHLSSGLSLPLAQHVAAHCNLVLFVLLHLLQFVQALLNEWIRENMVELCYVGHSWSIGWWLCRCRLQYFWLLVMGR